jgi:hypothetical protein
MCCLDPFGMLDSQVVASCVTVQPDDCVALALQQHGERSALRKGLGHNVVSFCFSFSKGWTIFAGIPFIPATGSLPQDPALLRGRHPIPSNFAVLTHCI